MLVVRQVRRHHRFPGNTMEVVTGGVLAGQEARCQREVREEGQVVLTGQLAVPLGILDVGAVQQVVLRLQGDRTRQPLVLGHLEPLLLPGRREVRQTDPTHLACLDELVESYGHVLDLLVVVVMGVVEIDVVGVEPCQGGIDSSRDVLSGQPPELGVGGHLRRDEDVVATAALLEP